MPSARIHVDGGFAVGASSFSLQGSPRSFSCATAWTANRSSSVSPSFNPRTILRERFARKLSLQRRRNSPRPPKLTPAPQLIGLNWVGQRAIHMRKLSDDERNLLRHYSERHRPVIHTSELSRINTC